MIAEINSANSGRIFFIIIFLNIAKWRDKSADHELGVKIILENF